MGETEAGAPAELRAAAGMVVDKPHLERLDWMYEQSAAQVRPDDEKLMNMPVPEQKDKDLEDMKQLGDNTAGSLFLRSATKTTEDMLRKLREDPLFQIRRQEQMARESAMANPLIRAKLEKKAEKEVKKLRKKEKKAAKKLKKKAKKAAKKASKKAAKGSSSSSSSDSDSNCSSPATGAGAAGRQASPVGASLERPRPLPHARGQPPMPSERRRADAELGPSSLMVSKREEYATVLAARKEAALASRGAPRRMDEAEKRRRLEQMQGDASRHEAYKSQRIASSEFREKRQEELEERMRMSSDQGYFRGMRQDAYMDSGASMADRLKNQRHRRQKNLNDPLEREG